MHTLTHTHMYTQASKTVLQVVILGASLGERIHFNFFSMYLNIVVYTLFKKALKKNLCIEKRK